jgi:hypothetical protein
LRRVAGEAMTREADAGAAAGAAAAAACGFVAADIAAAAIAGAADFADGAPSDAGVSDVSNAMSSEPTATMSPGWPVIDTTRPVTGEGISTAALSVITSAMT